MKEPATDQAASPDVERSQSQRHAADSFSYSVLLLIGVMISQRAIGLVRNVLFCGLLSEEELGRWALVNNYLGWAAPFFILGLPGSFGRLSEHFRSRGELRTMLRRTAVVSLGLVAAALAVHCVVPSWFAALIYNQPEQTMIVPLIGLVLGAVMVMNYLVDFLVSVRCNRIVSHVYLTQSLGFAVLSVVLLATTSLREQAVLVAFGLASVVAAVVGASFVARQWRELPATQVPVPAGAMWRKITTLAVWIWCGNSVANLFDCADQFLLKHYCDLAPAVVDAMIGQLYASRVLPVLIVSVAMLIAGCLLPYLIQDWELGRTEQLRQRMNGVIKSCSIGFTLIAAVTHILSPVLFGWLLRGKYDLGLELMPWGFVQYSWFSLLAIVNKYLICVDKPRAGMVSLLVGLAAAVGLVVLVLPMWGLPGVVVATTAANGIALCCGLVVTNRSGMRWDRSVLLATVVPLSLCLGGGPAIAILAALIVGGWHSEWLVTSKERHLLREICGSFVEQLRSRVAGRFGGTALTHCQVLASQKKSAAGR